MPRKNNASRTGIARKFLLYAVVGGVGTAAQYVVLIALVSLRLLAAPSASVVGAIVGAVINYFLNARFTFKSPGSHRLAATKFAIIAVLGAILNGLAMKGLIEVFEIRYLIAQLMSTAAIFFLTFIFNTLWTFKHAAHPLEEKAGDRKGF